MKVKKKSFKIIKNKYKHYLEQTKINIETTNKKISNYSPEYGPKEDLHRDMFRFIDRFNLITELIQDIKSLEGKIE